MLFSFLCSIAKKLFKYLFLSFGNSSMLNSLFKKDRDRETVRETGRQRERQRKRKRERERHRNRERQTETETDRDVGTPVVPRHTIHGPIRPWFYPYDPTPTYSSRTPSPPTSIASTLHVLTTHPPRPGHWGLETERKGSNETPGVPTDTPTGPEGPLELSETGLPVPNMVLPVTHIHRGPQVPRSRRSQGGNGFLRT